MQSQGKHVVEVRAINEEIALNMISTDGIFYKGKAPAKSNPPVIHGADNIKIGVGQVDTFDKMNGVSYSDDIDTTGLQINVTGELGKPTPGTNKANGVSVTDLEDGDLIKSLQLPTLDLSSLTEGNYSVKYEVTDSDNNTIIVERKIIVLSNKVNDETKPGETPDVPVTPDTPEEKPEETPDVSETPGSSDETSDNTNSNNETNKNPEKLPSTGNVLSNYVVVLGSLLLVALGLVLTKRKITSSK
ncbi:immunoglobulin-like domain-containing protein [Clostridium sp.]|uniref:immunoglobulin-like domain-containing protein n=1 Tax=Clostridium sp. TaxID=1506 RepID=UPI001B49EDC8|nr:immunoglobulin-like domain-containing protein [Clostridium sp.]MBP3916910.1 LPXTG cell wall anchor domain-containing protein [Clostridium sp.]